MSEVKAVVDRFYTAMNAHDPQKVAELLSTDVQIEAPGGLVLRGREAFVKLLETYLVAFPDLVWTITRQAVGDDGVVTESMPEGTHKGAFRTPGGEIPATGKRVASRVCDVLRVQEGEIVSVHLYWDNLEFMQSLGALPG